MSDCCKPITGTVDPRPRAEFWKLTMHLRLLKDDGGAIVGIEQMMESDRGRRRWVPVATSGKSAPF